MLITTISGLLLLGTWSNCPPSPLTLAKAVKFDLANKIGVEMAQDMSGWNCLRAEDLFSMFLFPVFQ